MSDDYRLDVAELLREGHSDRAIIRQLHCSADTVRKTRTALGISARTTTRQQTAPEELFRSRTRPVDGGHLEWIGSWEDGVPKVRVGGRTGRRMSAYRLAFLVGNGREPERPPVPDCGREHCVAPEHMTDEARGRPVDREREERERELRDALTAAKEELEQAQRRYEGAREALREFRRDKPTA